MLRPVHFKMFIYYFFSIIRVYRDIFASVYIHVRAHILFTMGLITGALDRYEVDTCNNNDNKIKLVSCILE